MKYPDPYDEMGDEEFNDWAARMLAGSDRSRMRSVTLRMPGPLVERTKRAAKAADIPYQMLMRRLVESGLDQLERGGSARTLAGLQRRVSRALDEASDSRKTRMQPRQLTDPDVLEKRRAALAKARAARAAKKRAQSAS